MTAMSSSPGFSSRLRAALAWLERELNQRQTTSGAVFIAIIALPVALLLWLMHVWALLDPAAAQLYRRELLWPTQLMLSAATLAYIATILYGLPRYRSQQPRPWLAYSLVTLMQVSTALLAVLYGYLDTPFAVIMLAGFALARAWFPLRVLMPGLMISASLIIAAEILTQQGRMVYAPLLVQPVINNGPFADWWGFWMRALYSIVVLPFSALLFFVFHIMYRHERALDALARFDPLTGLANRAGFMQQLAVECAKQGRSERPACVLMCDIDHFKQVNDNYGHAAGDVVLACLGRLLQDATRQPVDVAGRLGGEEFALLLPETGPAAARTVAERIAAQLHAQRFEVEGQRFGVTLSIGIACFSDGQGDKALQLADRRLYAAKEAGRDRIVSG